MPAPVSPKEWWQAIQDGYVAHHTDDRKNLWKRMAQFYRSGGPVPKGRKAFFTQLVEEIQGDDLRVNVTQAVVENLVSTLWPEFLRASVLPRRPGSGPQSLRVQDWLNNRVVPESDLWVKGMHSVYHTVIFGDGFLKEGFTDVPRQKAGLDLDETDTFSDPDSAIQSGGDLEFPDGAAFRGDMPWFDNVYPWQLIPAPGSLSLNDAPWVAQRIRKRFDDVVRNPIYENRSKLTPFEEERHEEGIDYSDEEMLTERTSMDQPGPDYIDLYEIWSMQDQRLYVIAAGHLDFYLRNVEWPFPGLEGYPYCQLGFNYDPESFYNIPLIEHFADLQEELNVTSSLMLESLKRSLPVNIYDKNRFSDTEIANLSSSHVGAFAGMDGAPRDGIDTYPKGVSFSPDAYGVRNMIIQSILLVTGQTDFILGQAQKTRSATEASISAQTFTGRMRFKQRLMTRWLRDVFRGTYQIAAPRMSTDQWVRTLGADGFDVVQVTPEDVRQEYDIDIDASIFDDRVQDPVRMKMALEAFQALATPDVAATVGANMVELARDFLQATGSKSVDKILPLASKPRPAEQENFLLSEGMEVQIHPLDNDTEHIQSHQEALGALDDVRGLSVFVDHIQKHQMALQAKLAAAEAQGGGGGGEAPSRRTTPSLQSDLARTQQTVNQ